METRASYVLVGAFMVICIAAFFVAMLWVAGSQYREEYTYYRTYFIGPVTGLGKGTIVRYNGIDAGHIAELAFDQNDPRLVIVTLQIDPTLQLHVDSVTSIESQGLTGASYVEIAGGTAGAPVLQLEPGQEYPVIPSKPSTLQQLTQSGPELIANLNVAGQRVGDLVNDENRKAIAEMLEHLRAASALVDQHSEDIDATLSNLRTITSGVAKSLDNVDRTLSTTDRALSSAEHALSSVEHTLSSVDTAVGSLNGAIGSADTTVKKLGQLSDDADKLVTGQGISQMTQLVAQTRALIASLNKLTSDLQREPTRFIFGDQRQGYTPK